MYKIKRKKSQLYAKKNKAGWPQQLTPITVVPGIMVYELIYSSKANQSYSLILIIQFSYVCFLIKLVISWPLLL